MIKKGGEIQMEEIGKTLMQTLVRSSNSIRWAVATRNVSSLFGKQSYMDFAHSCFRFLPNLERNLKFFKKF